MELLLNKGASATSKVEGDTPTQLAIRYDKSAVYDLLVSRGGIPVDRRSSAQIAFVQTAGDGDVARMAKTRDNGARIDGKGPEGRTALINALRTPIIEQSRADAVRWLLDNGADPNATGDSGYRDINGIPLHIFIVMKKFTMKGMKRRPKSKLFSEKTLMRLLKAGAKVSGMDEKMRTPPHFATKSDNVWAAKILIDAGARIMPRDNKGRTPLDFAESAAMIGLLKENGATER